MKKIIIIGICIIIAIFITDIIIFSIMGFPKKNQKIYNNNEITYRSGKDTSLSIGNGKFQIFRQDEQYDLCEFVSKGQLVIGVQNYVQRYKIINNKYFIISEDGYSIIDSNDNTGKLLITVKKQKSSYSTSDLEGITILKSYHQFSQDERNIFEKLKKSNWWYGHIYTYKHNTNIFETKTLKPNGLHY